MKVGVRMLGSCVALLATAAAYAGTISDPVLQIQATSALGSGSFSVPYNPANYDPVTGEYRFSLTEPFKIRVGGAGALLATVESLQTFLITDPLVSLGYVITAGGSNVNLTVSSAVVGFTAIPGASGTTSAQIGCTDNDGNGATITGGFAGGLGYRAAFNGGVPGGTTFATLVPGFTVGPFGSDNRNGNVPTTPMGTVADMSAQFSFGLTANDSASGTNVYFVPEPTTLALLALAGLALIRRR